MGTFDCKHEETPLSTRAVQHHIESLDDPRLVAYRHLKETNATRWAQRFVAEGEKLVVRLLASGLSVESLLVGLRHAERFGQLADASTAVYVVPDEWIEQIVGFDFHRGVLACGKRPQRRRLSEIPAPTGQRATVVVCPNVQDPENLGAILRLSGAFGVDAVLLGPDCPNPYSRRVLRVSMGAAFTLPIVEAADLETELAALAHDWGCQRWATVLDASAEPLAGLARPQRLALLLGSEGHGLGERWIAHCDRQVTIPMRPGTDSLNVAVATGIFLYQLDQMAT
jgi:tRNA G18 (ribose-2'-O)-methylase SpoU